MSKYNADIINAYLTGAKSKNKLALETIKDIKYSTSIIGGVCAGTAIPYAFVENGQIFSGICAGLAATSGVALLINHVIEKRKKKEHERLCALEEHSKAVLEDYNDIKFAVSVTNNGGGTEYLMRKLSAITKSTSPDGDYSVNLDEELAKN